MAQVIAVLLVLIAVPAAAEQRAAQIVSDVAVWSAIGLDTWHQARRDEPKRALTCEAMRLGLAVGVSELGKRIVREERPDKSDRKSFPSMHTAVATQAAGWRYSVGIPLAALAGGGRILGRRHFWWDVLAGAGVGAVSTTVCKGGA